MIGETLAGLKSGLRKSLPIFIQSEASECGLAALAMVAAFHGHDVDLAGLRRRYATSLKGVYLTQLMSIATDLGFATRPLRLDMDDLDQLKLPCILHWNMDHFVVLKRVTRNSIVIHDPAGGLSRYSFAETSKHFTGIALELTPNVNFKRIQERREISISGLLGNVHGIRRSVGTIIGLAIAIEAFTIILPLFTQLVMDQVLVSADLSLLTLLVVTFSLLIVFQASITAARAWSVTWLSNSMYAQWSANLFSHMLNLPMNWYMKRHVGDIISRYSSLQFVQQTLTTSFTTSILEGVMVVAVVALMFGYSASITFIVLAAFLLYATVRWFLFPPLRRAQEEQLVYTARQQSVILESLRAIQAITIANKGHQRLALYSNATVSAVNRGIVVQRYKIAFDTATQLMLGLLRIAIISIAAKEVIAGNFTTGMLVAFLVYADQFFTRATGLIDKIGDLRMLRLHAERIADIALADPEDHLQGNYETSSTTASIEMRNVSFRYANGEPWILQNCNLFIAQGESVALVGASGGGKSTVAKLILGLLPPTEGEILFGGVDIRRIGLKRYREMTSAVMQDDTLLPGSVADNISFFDSQAQSARIELIARAAMIHDDIASMPMGYNSLVGDMGSVLSGGQKQRLLLARALYNAPKLLVLDEATSHLDVHCERAINHAVQHSGATRVVIAHRAETIASTDRALCIRDGTVYEVTDTEASIRTMEQLRVDADLGKPETQFQPSQRAGPVPMETAAESKY